MKFKLKEKVNSSIDNDIPISSGYGVPYGNTGFGAGNAAGFYQQQQQQYNGSNFGYANQYQNTSNIEGIFGGAPLEQTVTAHRRHHRHHRHHTVEAENNGNERQDQMAPE